LSPIAEPGRVPGNIEPALGRDFLAPLGYDRDLVRLQTLGDREHFVGERHLQIEHRSNGACDFDDVVVLHMPAIFAQMCGDPIRACIFAERGGGHGVRLVGSPRLAQRRDMIDVYVEALVSCWHVHA